MKPVVAIVGRPNVGKSTLFNRLVGKSRSIVADEPGVTRDRIYAEAKLSGPRVDRGVVLVDTGGFDPRGEDPFAARILDQTQLAIDEADVVVFLTDGRAGLLPEDRDVALFLRKAGKRAILAINKVDGPQQGALMHEIYGLGIEPCLEISAAHGRNIGELGELILELLPAGEEPEEEHELEEDEGLEGEGVAEAERTGPIRVAVIGRPNVGKSSLVNRLLGEDRHLVSDVAGTTRDAIDSLIHRDERDYLFIDTAGIRRKRSIAHRVEKFSVVAALKGLDRSDVALLLIDPSQEIADQDAKVSSFAYEKGKAVILVVSKWDTQEGEQQKAEFTERLRQAVPHLAYAPVVFTSAKSGYGLDRLFRDIERVYAAHGRRVTTGELNRFLELVKRDTPPPSKRGRSAKIYYITQVGVRPPRFQVSVNDPELLHFSYRRYLVNELRRRYGYEGVPLLVGYRSRTQKADAGGKRPAKRPAKPAGKGASKTEVKSSAKGAARKPGRGKPAAPTAAKRSRGRDARR